MTSETSVVPFEQREVTYTPLGESDQLTLKVEAVRNVVSSPTKKGHPPTDRDVMRFMMLCKARGLNPFVGDAYLVGYDSKDGPTFSLITSTQALRKRAEAHPEFDGCKRGVIVKRGSDIIELEGAFMLDGDALLGGWAIAKRKDQATATVEKVKLSSYASDNKFWRKDPEGMITKVAEAAALRRLFPSDVGQMHLAEEFGGHDAPASTSGANISRDPITDALSGPKGALPVPAVEETPPPQDAPDGPTVPQDEPPSESDLERAGMLFQTSENTGQ